MDLFSFKNLKTGVVCYLLLCGTNANQEETVMRISFFFTGFLPDLSLSHRGSLEFKIILHLYHGDQPIHRRWPVQSFNGIIPYRKFIFRQKSEWKYKINVSVCWELFFFWSSWFSISHPYLSPSHQVGCSHISTHNSVSVFLTYEQVPLCVQISLVGQAALHDIEAVVVTGSHGGQASAVGAVQHLHEGTDAPRGWAHLWIFWKDWANQKFEGWVGEK